MVIQSAVAGRASTFGDPIEEVLAWHAQNRVAVAIAVGLEALNLPLLLGFVTGLHGLVGRRGGAGADWSRLAVARERDSLGGLRALRRSVDRSRAVRRRARRAEHPAFELVWQLHAAAFALALPALGTTFIGAALAAHTNRLTPPWQRLLGVAREPAARRRGGQPRDRGRLGAPVRGLPGFFAWPVWLLATGVRLVRARTADRPDNASTYDE